LIVVFVKLCYFITLLFSYVTLTDNGAFLKNNLSAMR